MSDNESLADRLVREQYESQQKQQDATRRVAPFSRAAAPLTAAASHPVCHPVDPRPRGHTWHVLVFILARSGGKQDVRKLAAPLRARMSTRTCREGLLCSAS
jgi:hypothetical protein